MTVPADGPDNGKTVDGALQAARNAGVDRLDALALLSAATRHSRSWLQAHGEAPIGGLAVRQFAGWVHRRAEGEPLAYLLGHKEFYGLALQVSPAVLVPRPDTETLVDWALDVLTEDADTDVLDLGTGSGAIALAIAVHRPRARVTAVDISAEALRIAQANGRTLAVAIEWLQGDWFAAVAGRRFGLIVANPPYVADGDPHLAALAHEPLHALTSGTDGLTALRTIVNRASDHLNPGGWLLLEHGQTQAAAVAALCAGAHMGPALTRHDLAGRPRCTGAHKVR